MDPQKEFFPFPPMNQFAVIRMNPIAMVQELTLDDRALSRARAMHPQKYLVYLDIPLQLPIPGHPWCKYSVAPVATVLRPDDPGRGLASDMVMPIHPNHRYAKGREPITPASPFPFDNCFFWIENDSTVRIPFKEELHDDSRAVKMGARAHSALMSCFEVEFDRIDDALDELERHRAKMKPSSTYPASPSSLPASSSDSLPDQRAPTDSMDTSDTTSGSIDDDDDDDAESVSSFREILALDIFGWNPDPSAVFLPLMDLWFEIEEHLTADTIPSPAELWREQEEIRQIIREGLERKELSTRESNPAAMVADIEVATAADSPSDLDMEMDISPDPQDHVEEGAAGENGSSQSQRVGDVGSSKRRRDIDEDISEPPKHGRHWFADVTSKVGGAFARSKHKSTAFIRRKDVTVSVSYPCACTHNTARGVNVVASYTFRRSSSLCPVSVRM
ncbi:hypothetical protein C8Q80DRAFT_475904 [Daedaleopsis nitida]|nr:hypothetical protein C8Q80DRAFT_475904 [Daedaleopsis nitida]